MLLHEILVKSANKNPDKIAVICNGRRFTYQQMDRYSDLLSKQLARFGIKAKDRVIILLDNNVEAQIAIFSTLKNDGVFVVLNTNIKNNKLIRIIKDSEAKFIIHSEKKKDRLSYLLKQEQMENQKGCKQYAISNESLTKDVILEINSIWVTIIKSSTNLESKIEIDPDLASLIYTSGSSGEPKGVMAGHSNILFAIQSITTYLHNETNDIVLNILPLSFDYGLYQAFMVFYFGGTIVLEKSLTYQTKIFQLIEKYNVTGLPIVPSMFRIIIKRTDIRKFKLESLRYISSTGETFPPAHIKYIRKILPSAKIYSMYGLTECKRVSYVPPEKLIEKIHSVGIPMPGVNVKIVKEDGRSANIGEIGELVVQGPNVMKGYWKDPIETKRIFKREAHDDTLSLYTGDLFRIDEDGYLYYVSRKDDLIKVNGERVAPKEIENVLYEIDGIKEAAVVGIRGNSGEIILKANIVIENGMPIGKQEILKYCNEHIESNKIPKVIQFLDALPKTTNEKIDRKSIY